MSFKGHVGALGPSGSPEKVSAQGRYSPGNTPPEKTDCHGWLDEPTKLKWMLEGFAQGRGELRDLDIVCMAHFVDHYAHISGAAMKVECKHLFGNQEKNVESSFRFYDEEFATEGELIVALVAAGKLTSEDIP